jgi:hypothetical protein
MVGTYDENATTKIARVTDGFLLEEALLKPLTN